ncbi:MAG: 2-hydroxychromene-2-carboxylate isomerase [Alphaproteobacteria bacterium]
MKHVDYYFTLSSPWTFLGHARFRAIAARTGTEVAYRPVDFGVIFPESGGLPLRKRAPQRQAYRLMELRRWSAYLGIPMIIEPRFFPVDDKPAARLLIAAQQAGQPVDLLTGALMAMVWQKERDLSADDTLIDAATLVGLDGPALLAASKQPAAQATHQAYTQEALARGVFGAPTFVYRDELFWGQDRLDFLERALLA